MAEDPLRAGRHELDDGDDRLPGNAAYTAIRELPWVANSHSPKRLSKVPPVPYRQWTTADCPFFADIIITSSRE